MAGRTVASDLPTISNVRETKLVGFGGSIMFLLRWFKIAGESSFSKTSRTGPIALKTKTLPKNRPRLRFPCAAPVESAKHGPGFGSRRMMRCISEPFKRSAGAVSLGSEHLRIKSSCRWRVVRIIRVDRHKVPETTKRRCLTTLGMTRGGSSTFGHLFDSQQARPGRPSSRAERRRTWRAWDPCGAKGDGGVIAAQCLVAEQAVART